MAKVLLKNSFTAASVPAGLSAGEMAVNVADRKLFVGNAVGGVVTLVDPNALVTSVNGITGAVGFTAGSNITITKSGLTLTIASSGGGITAGGANVFTALQSFSAGISASSGVTFASDIRVNSLTVGVGGGGSIFNVAVGSNALLANTTGIFNVAVGSNALLANTSGNFNFALGSNALVANTTGSTNVALGIGALATNISGNSNVALGGSALAANGTGSNNVAVGPNALYANTTGTDNLAVGSNALDANTTGTDNLGVGTNALGANTTGTDNLGVGTNALGANTTGSTNVALGRDALGANTTGSTNVALGRDAGRYRGTATDANSTGQGGIYIGYQARGSTLARTNEIVIGVNAIGLGSNTAVIGATLQSAATIYGVLNLPSGLSASGATFSGNISAPNIVTVSTANTFTQLNTFSAGITSTTLYASAGVTFNSISSHTGLATFNGGLTANGATFSGNVNLQDKTISRVELLDYFERYVDLGDFTNKGAQIPIDLSTAQVFRTKLTVAAIGLTLSNIPDNANANAVGFSLLFVGDGTARTMTWNIGSTAASWAGGTAPTYTSTLNKIDVFSFLSRDGGSTWLGFVGGQNF